jgi:hypothetical protein
LLTEKIFVAQTDEIIRIRTREREEAVRWKDCTEVRLVRRESPDSRAPVEE